MQPGLVKPMQVWNRVRRAQEKNRVLIITTMVVEAARQLG